MRSTPSRKSKRAIFDRIEGDGASADSNAEDADNLDDNEFEGRV
jgi:hypothetical protein